MGMFQGLNEAKPSSGGNYLPEGDHRVRLEALRFKKSENRESKNENVFIVETSVVSSSDPSLKAGSKRDWVLGIPAKTEDKMRAYGDMKSFFAALAGVEDVDSLGNFEAIAEAAIGANNPCRNLEVDVEVRVVKTRAGGNFSKHRWQTDGSGANLAIVRALAGGPAPAPKATTAADPALPPGWTRRADGTFVPPAGA